MTASFLAGSLFGAALASTAVWLPDVILSQLRMEDFHMLKSFLIASAASTVLFTIHNRLSTRRIQPRKPSPLGLAGTYDGNVIGGAILGLGLALSGACPGTVLVQVANGIPSGKYALLGAIIGAVIYVRLNKIFRKNSPQSTERRMTVSSATGINESTAIVLFEIFCFMIVAGINIFGPFSSKVLPDGFIGGLGIGAAQLGTILLTENPVGVSGGYVDAGAFIWDSLENFRHQGVSGLKPPRSSPLSFVGGVFAGAVAFRALGVASYDTGLPIIPPMRAFSGGVALIFGARLAGGCTSGHGISGLSTLGISSFLTMASMFVSGALFAALVT